MTSRTTTVLILAALSLTACVPPPGPGPSLMRASSTMPPPRHWVEQQAARRAQIEEETRIIAEAPKLEAERQAERAAFERQISDLEATVIMAQADRTIAEDERDEVKRRMAAESWPRTSTPVISSRVEPDPPLVQAVNPPMPEFPDQWYTYEAYSGECEPKANPARMIEGPSAIETRLDDVTEGGKVVETEVTVMGLSMRLYRGLERCQAVADADRDAKGRAHAAAVSRYR